MEDRKVLAHFLSDLRREGTALPLSARLARHLPEPDNSLIEHVKHLAPVKRNR